MGKISKRAERRNIDPNTSKTTPASNPTLFDQIQEHETVRERSQDRKHQNRHKHQSETMFVDEKLSKKILLEARKQQEELEEEHGVGKKKKVVKDAKISLGSSQKLDESESDEESDTSDVESTTYYEHIDVAEEDERALEMFMKPDAPARRTLADIIREKITEKQTEIGTHFTGSEAGGSQAAELDPRVVEMYKGVQKILCKYRSGKLPKAFKIIPSLAVWEQILMITQPETWTAAAIYQATRIFASNLKEKMAQRFFNIILLPRIRDDIAEFKRLNFHLYQALRKALFKPGAFFKGILLPLCEEGNCTLREAIIIGSVLSKNSIPVLHSSAAMLKIADMDYSGANSIFLRLLIDKKYALPYRVVDSLVFHFLRFQSDQRSLPVLWHQALLTLAQRYKEDLSSEQKAGLLELLKTHSHPQITPEIRRELQHAKCRDVEISIEQMAVT